MSVPQEVEQSKKPWPWHFDSADHRLSEEERQRAEKVVQKYLTENKKLFPRDTLSKISTILKDRRRGELTVDLQDYVDGSNRPYKIKLDLGPQGNALTRLNYVPVQRLMNPYWCDVNRMDTSNAEPLNPLQVVSESYDTLGEDKLATENFDDWLREANKNWLASKKWKTIQQTFEKISDANFPPIEKVIAFEIGSMWRAFTKNKPFEHRLDSFEDRVWQHALIKAMGDYLRQRTGNNVQLYVQDPTYTAEDLRLLQDLGLQRLEEPAGFTEIDERTLVYSTHAPIPVMQIIADME